MFRCCWQKKRKLKRNERKNALQPTSGFTQAGVYARRQFCADLEVYRPPEPLCNPRLRQAATTLYAMREAHTGFFGKLFEITFELQIDKDFTSLRIRSKSLTFLLPRIEN